MLKAPVITSEWARSKVSASILSHLKRSLCPDNSIELMLILDKDFGQVTFTYTIFSICAKDLDTILNILHNYNPF